MIDMVVQQGWTYFECRECREVVYEGSHVGLDDLAELVRFHAFACAALAGESTP